MFDSRVFDVVLGLAAVYSLLALGCSWIGEWVASLFELRAATLEHAIEQLLIAQTSPSKDGKTAKRIAPEDVFAHALIAPLARRGWGLRRRSSAPRPSHLPCWLLARALWDLAGPSSTDAEADLEKAVAGIPIDSLRALAQSSLQAGRTKASEVRADLETYIESQMDRARGWYARNMQLVVVVIAGATTLALNVNSAAIAESLWNDDAARAAMTAEADHVLTLAPAADADPTGDHRDERAAALVALVDLPVPVGWTTDPRGGTRCITTWDGGTILHRLAGWLATIIALSLGAPFWFGILDRLLGLRLGGARTAAAPQATKAS